MVVVGSGDAVTVVGPKYRAYVDGPKDCDSSPSPVKDNTKGPVPI